jgi:UDP-glucose 4-epimerase
MTTKLKNRRILVTGGAGFIGSHTVDALLKAGANVVIIDNLVTGRRENLNPEAKFYNMNIADPEVDKIFKQEKPEIIYHFAFNVLVPKSVENLLMDIDSIAGAANVFQNANRYGVKKTIFASSGFVYGNNQNIPVKETEPIDFVSPYVVAKYAAENYLRYFRKVYGLPHVIFRYAAIYGPRQITGAMADYIRKLSSGQQAEIWGDGSKTRDYVYIDDVVHANIMALDLPLDYPNPVFNIGTGIETTLNDVYKNIAAILGKEAKPIYLLDRPGEQMRYALDSSKIKNVLNWQQTVELKDGLKRRIASFNAGF